MTKAKENKSTIEAISAVTESLAKIGIDKKQRNKYDGYNFRGIDDVYNALAPIISQHNLVIAPNVLDVTTEERQTAKGGAIFSKTVLVEYFVKTAADDGIKLRIVGEGMDRGDKAINKAMSAAYKNLCFQLFCIPVQGDDSENESHEVVHSKKKQNIAWMKKAKAELDNLKTPEKVNEWPKKTENAKALSELSEKQKEAMNGLIAERLAATSGAPVSE